MRRKGKESKFNVALTFMLIVFVSLLSFSIGVISGKGLSDKEYALKSIEENPHYQQAKADSESQPLSEEMTEKEIELMTQKALEQARKEKVDVSDVDFFAEDSETEQVAEKTEAPAKEATKVAEGTEENLNTKDMKSDSNSKEMQASQPVKESDKKAMAPSKTASQKRAVSSLPPASKKTTLPKPKSIEYTVQVASYKTMGEAEEHSQKLIDKGFPAFPVKAVVKGNTWFRVSIGSFKNRKQAIKYQKNLKKEAVVKNSIVQKVKRQ